jgi:hypothetical protein
MKLLSESINFSCTQSSHNQKLRSTKEMRAEVQSCKTELNWVTKSIRRMTRKKSLERWKTKTGKSKFTPQALWSTAKSFLSREGPRALTAFQSQSYIKTERQSASLSWNKAPIWGLRLDLYYCQTMACLLMWGALSDEKRGLSFAMHNILTFSCYLVLFIP